MLIYDLVGLLEFLTNLIGLPFLSVLIGFFILVVELFLLGLLMLMAVWRIRKELINLNCKIDLLTQPSKIESEKETEKEPQKEFGQDSKNELEKEPEAQADNELEKGKYRYKWK